MGIRTYLQNNGTALSRLLSTILGGDPEDTISLRLGKCKQKRKICFYLCKFLNLFEEKHCKEAMKRKSLNEDTELWSWK